MYTTIVWQSIDTVNDDMDSLPSQITPCSLLHRVLLDGFHKELFVDVFKRIDLWRQRFHF